MKKAERVARALRARATDPDDAQTVEVLIGDLLRSVRWLEKRAGLKQDPVARSKRRRHPPKKRCSTCNRWFFKRPDESTMSFKRRVFCSPLCRNTHIRLQGQERLEAELNDGIGAVASGPGGM